jgi:hypothetical protein
MLGIMPSTSNNAQITRGKPFKPGNKFGQGRPAGSRNKATLVLEALLDGEGEEVVRTMLTEAKAGNMTAAKALLDRLVPPRKSVPTAIEIPLINDTSDLEAVLFKVANDMATGELTPDEAQAITSVIANHIKLHETLKIEDRISQLEKAVGNQHSDTPPAER